MARRKKSDDKREAIRRGAMIVAIILFMYAISVDSPARLARSGYSMLGAAVIGVTAGVEPNQYNTLAQQLSDKQKELDAREAALNAQSGGSLVGTRSLAAASFATSVLLLVLVAGNYYLDFRRSRTIA